VEGAWQTAGGRGRPNWIAPADGGEMSARVVTQPVRSDVDRSINEQLIVELYSK
jgi:ribosomal protein S4